MSSSFFGDSQYWGVAPGHGVLWKSLHMRVPLRESMSCQAISGGHGRAPEVMAESVK